jgi:hypothetical protein
MTELSNAVTVLIARMESHPEDFEYEGKFYHLQDGLYGLAGLLEGKANSYWFLSDADRQALVEAWKKYHRTRMEKQTMEAIFDDGAEERERAAERIKIKQQMYQAQQTAMAQNQRLSASTGTYQTTTIKPGQIHPLHNAAQNNTGLLGSAANAFSGIFK